ncbi:putative capsular polysaccharide synthesis enzyme Cap5A [Staphylococcus piscifermentans]|uniref:Capsular polysaccharide type 5 biosynthesis protein cap5A n=1 Tax=Staphylococcus piscifermentans TaxID=70258 RepID=A0A239TEE9_9STAP|nr:Wzz/FepE/Etk N-terminal domain-containing protein [Staphylococcus piscifermentans]RTX86695.1 capsule biosynthesis protein CapA [Staphylococcus piscifermentans]GEP83666.1 capsular polysaccharide type 5 biosynthesis protein cap5A [Staphylococcus piscifermentans]SNU96085.1 putative capsular polysaccharide synthesis enzyme Cap5A [Staphylococcus piscifermentans]
MEKTIDLSKLIKILKKNLKWLIILPIIFLVISLIFTFTFVKPKYSASTQVLVNQKQMDNQVMAQQVQSNIQLVKTYSEIIKSPRILDKASKKLDGKYSSGDLSNMLTVTNQAESQIMDISIVSGSKKESKKIANTIAEVFSKDADKIMNIDNVSILSKAETVKQVSPKPLISSIVALLLGLLIALLIISLKEVFDKRIKTDEDVEEILNLPVLGSIPDLKK